MDGKARALPEGRAPGRCTAAPLLQHARTTSCIHDNVPARPRQRHAIAYHPPPGIHLRHTPTAYGMLRTHLARPRLDHLTYDDCHDSIGRDSPSTPLLVWLRMQMDLSRHPIGEALHGSHGLVDAGSCHALRALSPPRPLSSRLAVSVTLKPPVHPKAWPWSLPLTPLLVCSASPCTDT
ncbi:myb dna-binding domain [Pyrenophora seminiperda CCB06]|uniref:Myb dna-binding domain n=1 Tax=Pyrenophora seminiperda CCB06 TaxID=1302712 RepID=A0A3M7M218_9PLEO|nr:myb dna-binding domain [Pyrenophora seminiperda CCB06]